MALSCVANILFVSVSVLLAWINTSITLRSAVAAVAKWFSALDTSVMTLDAWKSLACAVIS
eukprot:8875043-Ditylum_brightwellii.AAC.1